MEERRIGRQTPTLSVVLPYSKTKGKEAIELYNSTGRTAQPWQELLVYDMMAVNEEELWTHTKFGLSVPRQNGKNEVVFMREMKGLLDGERILHTAHRSSTSHASWERIYSLLAKAGYREKEDYTTLKQFGFETIRMVNGDGVINFRTRSSKGGLGEGYDLLIVDEAQEYTEDQKSALQYVIAASDNPQTIMCGTPPTAVSSGTVFLDYRRKTVAGNTQNGGWAEWSVDFQSDPRNVDLWYETNPSLGLFLKERTVADEIGTDVVDFNIQRLGLWLTYNQKSAISLKEWEALKCDKKPKLKKTLFVGVKFGVDGSNVAMSVAAKTDEGKIFVEALDCRPIRNGFTWILDYLKALEPKSVIIDGAGNQKLLSESMRRAKIKGAVLPTVKEVVVANAQFEQGIFSKTLCHMDQPALKQAAGNCEKRTIGNGGFGYKALKEGIEIALLDSAILAFWACSESKERKRQQVRC